MKVFFYCDFAISSYSKTNCLVISTVSSSTLFLYAPGELRASANTLHCTLLFAHHVTRFFDASFAPFPVQLTLCNCRSMNCFHLILCRPTFLFSSVCWNRVLTFQLVLSQSSVFGDWVPLCLFLFWRDGLLHCFTSTVLVLVSKAYFLRGKVVSPTLNS